MSWFQLLKSWFVVARGDINSDSLVYLSVAVVVCFRYCRLQQLGSWSMLFGSWFGVVWFWKPLPVRPRWSVSIWGLFKTCEGIFFFFFYIYHFWWWVKTWISFVVEGGFVVGCSSMWYEFVWIEREVMLIVMLYMGGCWYVNLTVLAVILFACFKRWVWSYSDFSLVHYACCFPHINFFCNLVSCPTFDTLGCMVCIILQSI